MAIAKDRIPNDLSSKVQAYVFNEYHKSVPEDEDGSQSINGFGTDSAITHSSINFRASGCYYNLMHANESLMSFQQISNGYNHWNQASPKGNMEPRLVQDINCLQMGSGYSTVANNGESSGEEAVVSIKRSSEGESLQAEKKQCSSSISATKKPKPKSKPSKDPQSIAAKNRRERISERLKILQELVPNGSKVDLVTMLEKAISYVKFLQLQVKVLATDEFWPIQGGRAPDISQVREAIDAILSSQKDTSSISK
ncbi:hypothetical protein L6164_033022 [Bauhinia variegata]|uniref:Uncharacterized protein n=1 Tax=Bauhinia variegata TaxID=167791 RepID=A0ACB9KQN9_BAUVA|nr:hypothetical protein L6164_033022 [Bauhinia variegata]